MGIICDILILLDFFLVANAFYLCVRLVAYLLSDLSFFFFFAAELLTFDFFQTIVNR